MLLREFQGNFRKLGNEIYRLRDGTQFNSSGSQIFKIFGITIVTFGNSELKTEDWPQEIPVEGCV